MISNISGDIYIVISYICISILIISYLDVVLFVVLSSEADDRSAGNVHVRYSKNQNKFRVNSGYPITAKLS